MRPKQRILSFFLYLLYGCILSAVLLIVFFPSDKIRQYVAQKVERTIPGTTCIIGSVTYDFPLTFRFGNIRLSGERRPEDILLFIQSLSVHADLQQHGLRVHAVLYDGEFQGRLFISREQDSLRLTDVQVHHLDLGKWGGLKNLLRRDVTGFLDVSGRYSGRFGRIFDGEAEGMAVVQDGSVALLQPVLSLTAVDLKNSEMEFTFHNSILTMKKGSFHGSEFDGTFAGTFHLAFPLESSMLEIIGDLAPTSSLIATHRQWKNIATMIRRRYKQSTLPFVVNGTLTGPRFRIGG